MEERKSRYDLFLEEEDTAPKVKRCSKCKAVKALSEYYKDNRRVGGTQACCKKCHSTAKYKNREDRFWKMFWPRVDHVGDCLEWNGAYSSSGYPVCDWKRKQIHVARLVYELAIGPISRNDIVLLSCNNKRCLRHSHLVLGTKEDRRVKGNNRAATGYRHRSKTCPDSVLRGESHPMAKLTEDKVRLARERHSQGASVRSLACSLGVAGETLQNALDGKTWAHVQ
jgi:hypothetical protein